MIQIKVNNKQYTIDAQADEPLLWVLRDKLKLKGTKYGCGIGQCGVCTVHLNGSPVRSCQLEISSAEGQSIVTIEGIGEDKLHAVQQSWIDEQVPQCGYCQSGQIMTAVALLSSNRNPSDDQIRTAMNGNLCRCGTYGRIMKAIRRASAFLANLNEGGAQ